MSKMTSSRVFDLASKSPLIGIFLLFCLPCTGYRCRLPKEWRGKYSDGGSEDVFIRGRIISTKGTCVEQSRGYYLFDNRKHSCFQCVLYIHRHHNILQYKESSCVAPESLKKVCGQIRTDTQMLTLVREPFVPVVCPMQGAFFFNYNDLAYGFCARPQSYARPCSNGSVYHLQFRHCVAEASLSGKDVVLECVATWMEGQENYLFGRMIGISSPTTTTTSSSSSSRDDAYRCFKYETSMQDEVRFSMSSDATCRGLRSFKDGPLVAEMTRDSFAWPTPSCMLPDWLNGVTWRDLDGTSRFSLDDAGEVLNEFQRRPGSRSTDLRHPTAVFRCIRILDYYRLDEEFIILSFSSLRCLSQLQCVKLRRRANSVVEFYPGSLIEYGYHGQCLSENEFHWMRILIPDDHPLTPCPRSGLHQTMALHGGCWHRLDVGCHNNSIISIETICGADRTTVVSLECLVVWSKEEISYVIARDQQTDILTCFSFRTDLDSSTSLLFGIDDTCNKHLNSIDSYSRQVSPAYAFVRNEYCSTAINNLLPVMRTGTPTPATSHGVKPSTLAPTSANYDDQEDLDLAYDLDYYDTEEEDEEEDRLLEAEPPSPTTGAANHGGRGHLAARKDVHFITHASNISWTRGFGAVSDNKGSRSAPESFGGGEAEVEMDEEGSGNRLGSKRYGSNVGRILTGGAGSSGSVDGRELLTTFYCLVCLELILIS